MKQISALRQSVLFAGLFLVPVLASCAHQQSPPPILTAADRVLTEAISEGTVPGAVLLVTQHGKTVHHQAYGAARAFDYGGDRRAQPIPMTTEHVFDLASLTKVFATTFGIMMLVDQGKVDLDAPVKTYLPLFTGTRKDSVTVRHLLTHTSGLYPWKPLYYHAATAQDTYAYISQLELAYPVGQQRRYSDLGFMLLGYLIEAVSEMPLNTFLQTHLYEPLGLPHTTFVPRASGLAHFAATSHGNPFERRMVADDEFGYQCDEEPEAFQRWRNYVLEGEVNDGNAYHAHEGVAGHAGLFATATDLDVLLQLLLHEGIYDGQRLLQQETIETFLTPTAFNNGLGWAMASEVLGLPDFPPGTFGHTGFTGTFALAVPAQDLTVILLTNRQQQGVLPSGYYPNITPLRQQIVAAVWEEL